MHDRPPSKIIRACLGAALTLLVSVGVVAGLVGGSTVQGGIREVAASQTAGIFKESGNVFTGKQGRVFIVQKGQGGGTIADFNAEKGDFLRLQDFGLTAPAAVKAMMTQADADTLLRLPDATTVRLAGVTLEGLPDSCFQLELDRAKLAQTFADDFDGFRPILEGVVPEKDGKGIWRTNYGWGPPTAEASRSLGNEQQVYTDASFAGTGDKPFGVIPFHPANGILEIWGEKAPAAMLPYIWGRKFTSGLITTKFSFSQLYGVFEIRAKLPKGRGFFPAFWLLPSDSSWPPEIDVFEMLGHDTQTLYSTTHSNATGEHTSVTNNVVAPDLSADFHQYALSWEQDEIRWYLDGVEVARTATPSDMHKAMYMLANLAVGSSWPGPTDASTPFPGIFAIDWIKAYKRKAPGTP